MELEAQDAQPPQSPIDKLAAELAGPIGDAQLDAVASELCRMMHETNAEIVRYSEAENAEIARIRVRYGFLKQPLADQYSRLEEMGREVARRADFGPKKKSRKVGFGSYGRKKASEKVKIIDVDKAVAFARIAAPEGIKTETVEKPIHAVLEPVVIAHLKATGEVPDGFEHTAEREDPFIKPGE